MIDEQVIFKEAKLTIKKRLILQWLSHCEGQLMERQSAPREKAAKLFYQTS